jgi:hypothetical protein
MENAAVLLRSTKIPLSVFLLCVRVCARVLLSFSAVQSSPAQVTGVPGRSSVCPFLTSGIRARAGPCRGRRHGVAQAHRSSPAQVTGVPGRSSVCPFLTSGIRARAGPCRGRRHGVAQAHWSHTAAGQAERIRGQRQEVFRAHAAVEQSVAQPLASIPWVAQPQDGEAPRARR